MHAGAGKEGSGRYPGVPRDHGGQQRDVRALRHDAIASHGLHTHGVVKVGDGQVANNDVLPRNVASI
jgi:hypothetical protein